VETKVKKEATQTLKRRLPYPTATTITELPSSSVATENRREIDKF
jgi:hypothetical protein